MSTSTIHQAKSAASAAEFLAQYDPSILTERDAVGRTVLLAALGNTDIDARLEIAGRLLDDGADAGAVMDGQVGTLHVLLGKRHEKIDGEAALLTRLLEGGADPNLVSPKNGSPLQILNTQYAYSDEQLAPFYDVLFARDDLDLLRPGAYRSTTFGLAVKARSKRPQLVERMETYLRDRGIPIPEEG